MPLPPPLITLHLFLIFPCIFIGGWLLLSRKGTGIHRSLGITYMVLMAATGILTLFIPAQVGPQLFGHFGMLHLLSLLTLWSVPVAWKAIRKGDITTHRKAMLRLYVGGILLAGTMAVAAEGRYLNRLLFGHEPTGPGRVRTELPSGSPSNR